MVKYRGWQKPASALSICMIDFSLINVHIGGQAWGFDPTKYMDPREARRRDRFCQLAVAATRMALDHAGLIVTEDNADDIGCIYGTGAGGLQSFVEFSRHIRARKGHAALHPFAVPMVIDDSASSAIAIDWNLRGPNCDARLGVRGRSRCDWAGLSVDSGRRCARHRDRRH